MSNAQLELTLTPPVTVSLKPPARARQTRATWWFNQMRRIVDGALDWTPSQQARPEQIVFNEAYRHIELSPR